MAPRPELLPATLPATLPASVPPLARPSCRGLRCLDREACFEFDAVARVARRTHASEACDVGVATDTLTLAYVPRGAEATAVERISVEVAQELMGCTYTSKLLFQSAHMLRNYAFWGFTGHSDEGFATVAVAQDAWALVSPHVAIGHATALEVSENEDPGLGLFATGALALGVLLGEYTGMIQVNADTTSGHDAYGVCYPAVFERGELRVSALEFGNEIRCINHSDAPNATFTPMIRRGVLHIYCFTTRPIDVGEQIFVDYGSEYWKGAGLEPVAC